MDRITKGERVRAAALAYQSRRADADEVEITNSENAKLRAEWDAIAKAIPEIEGQAISSGIGPFREIVERQNILPGKLEVLEGDGVEVAYEGRSLDLLSDSERYRVGLVLQSAIVELFEFPFIVIDRTDILVDLAARAAFSATIFAIAESRPVLYFKAMDPDEIKTLTEPDEDEQLPTLMTNPDIDIYVLADSVARRLT